MFEQIEDYFYGVPGRIAQLGRWMVLTGAFLIVAGAIGQVMVRTANAFSVLAKQTESTKVLADIYPTLPLWWVPESWFGIFFSVAVIAIGIAVNTYGKKIERILRGM